MGEEWSSIGRSPSLTLPPEPSPSPPRSVEELASRTPVPGAKKAGGHCLRRRVRRQQIAKSAAQERYFRLRGFIRQPGDRETWIGNRGGPKRSPGELHSGALMKEPATGVESHLP